MSTSPSNPRSTAGFAPSTRLTTSRSQKIACLLLVLGCLGAGSAAGQTPLEECLDEVGMAFVGGHSAAVANSNSVFLFGGPGGGAVLCGAPVEASIHALASASLGEAWLAGTTGLMMTTAAIAGPAQSSIGRGFLAGDLVFRFRVVPDDPTSTAPVDVEFTTRTWVLTAQLSTAGAGRGSQSFGVEYWVGPVPVPSIFPIWEYEDLAPIADTTTDVFQTVSVPVNADRYFIASLRQSSYSQGRLSPDGSGASTLTTLWSFEASTDAAATIVWDVETELGLSPELDVVPEPDLGGLLVLIAATAADAASRGRRLRGVAPIMRPRRGRFVGRFRIVRSPIAAT